MLEVLEQIFSGAFLKMPGLDWPFVCHVIEVDYVRRTRELVRIEILFYSEMADLTHCCLPCLFSLPYLILGVGTYISNLDLRVCHCLIGLMVGWHNTKPFSVPLSRHELACVATPTLCYNIDSPRCIFVATPQCFFFFPGLVCH